jgi:hypothetical protein
MPFMADLWDLFSVTSEPGEFAAQGKIAYHRLLELMPKGNGDFDKVDDSFSCHRQS